MKRPPNISRSVLAAAVATSACVSGFDRNDQTVNSLRILGAAAHIDNGDGVDWADAEVGDTVTLQALVANPTGVPDVTVTWVTCMPSLNKTVTPCSSETRAAPAGRSDPHGNDDPASGVILLGVGETIQFTVPKEVQPLLDALIANADANLNAQCSLYTPTPVIIIAQGERRLDGQRRQESAPVALEPGGPQRHRPGSAALHPQRQPPHRGAQRPQRLHSACAGQTLVASCQTDADCGGGTCSADGWCPPRPVPVRHRDHLRADPRRPTPRRITTAGSTGSTAVRWNTRASPGTRPPARQAGIANKQHGWHARPPQPHVPDHHPPAGPVHTLRRRAGWTGRRELDRAGFPMTPGPASERKPNS